MADAAGADKTAQIFGAAGVDAALVVDGAGAVTKLAKGGLSLLRGGEIAEATQAASRVDSQLAKYGDDFAELQSIIGDTDTAGMMRRLRHSEVVGMADEIHPATNAHLENLSLHERLDRFYVRADELLNNKNVRTLHPINETQMFGDSVVGLDGETTIYHGGVRNLSNEGLLKFGGPQGNDAIKGFREWQTGDDFRHPASQINIRGGHHRLEEIRRRVLSGSIDKETLIEFLKVRD